MALSRANCARRVPSRNQRRTSTACLKQPSARVPARVPRRWRSACNRPETNSTVSSRTLNVAVYVTLILTRNPYEVDLWTDQPSYRGSASSRCTPTTSACRTASARRQLPNVTTALRGMAQWPGRIPCPKGRAILPDERVHPDPSLVSKRAIRSGHCARRPGPPWPPQQTRHRQQPPGLRQVTQPPTKQVISAANCLAVTV